MTSIITIQPNTWPATFLPPGQYLYDDTTRSYHPLAAPVVTSMGHALSRAELDALAATNPTGTFVVGPIHLAASIVLVQSYNQQDGWKNTVSVLNADGTSQVMFSGPAEAADVFAAMTPPPAPPTTPGAQSGPGPGANSPFGII